LAIGGKSGILRIFEMNLDLKYYRQSGKNEDENILSYLKLINQRPYREYYDHKSEIVDLCWSHFNNKLILTASLDHFVILWNINNTTAYMKFLHSSMVTCISFCPSIVRKKLTLRKMAMKDLYPAALIGLYVSGVQGRTKSSTLLIEMNTSQLSHTSLVVI
jgi:WD40 repeat protein